MVIRKLKKKKRAYVEKRRRYKKAVRRAKNRFEEGRQVNLDKLVRSPKKWWTEVRKLGLISGKNKSRTTKCMMRRVL